MSAAETARGGAPAPQMEKLSHSPEETIEFGRELARRLIAPVLVLLYGELGSGKTTLTKGIISGLGAGKEEDVTSPTFTLVHVFRNQASPNQPRVYHADLYRIENFHDLETVALEDALSEPAIVIVEWSERFALKSEWPRIVVHLEHVEDSAGDDVRRISVTG